MGHKDNSNASARRSRIDAFVCQSDDTIWKGIELSLDNGFGTVLVADAAGRLIGRVGLDELRAALRDGAHLSQTKLADLARALDQGDAKFPLMPVLNDDGCILDVAVNRSSHFVPVSEPDLSHQEFRNLLDAFLSTWISSTGDYVRSFEQRFANHVEMAHGVATSNGTVALHLALAALRVGHGDEVIVPDLTFAATANAVIHVGARPVIVDVDPDTWCISPETMERAITSRTKAVIPVHVFGRPAPMTEIAKLSRSRNLFIIEDCAEAHGARYDGRPVGSFSDVATYSFFANKIMTTGEGGICLTNEADIAARLRMLRDHGMHPERRYWHEEAGFNFRMTNLQAAIGCAQLERLGNLLAIRREVHRRYVASFSHLRNVAFPSQLPARFEPVVWFSCVLVDPAKRPRLIAACKEANIDLRPFFYGLSAMPAYRSFASPCEHSSALSASGINLPTSSRVDHRIAEKVASIFADVLEPEQKVPSTRTITTSAAP